MIEGLVYTPAMTKVDLFLAACEKIPAICDLWGIPVPAVHPTPHPRFLKRRFGSGGKHFGYYNNNEIWVNVQDSSSPVKVRGRAWSYPGNKTDRCSSGILFHELGHHVCENVKMSAEKWVEIVSKFKSEAVSGYEPTYEESFSETIRLFISNPDLLGRACPRRFDYLTQYLQPCHSLVWREVLEFAPEFIIDNASRWAKETH